MQKALTGGCLPLSASIGIITGEGTAITAVRVLLAVSAVPVEAFHDDLYLVVTGDQLARSVDPAPLKRAITLSYHVRKPGRYWVTVRLIDDEHHCCHQPSTHISGQPDY